MINFALRNIFGYAMRFSFLDLGIRVIWNYLEQSARIMHLFLLWICVCIIFAKIFIPIKILH